MPRPRNQTARREQIIDAALAVIADRGLPAVRIADVARRAGTSTGTIHYYFGDLETLIDEVHRRAVDRFCVARDEIVATGGDPADVLARLVRAGLPTSQSEPLVIALYEVGVMRRSSVVNGMLLRALHERQVAIYAGVLALGSALGRFTVDESPAEIASVFVGLEDAYGLYIVCGTGAVTAETAADRILAHAAHVLGCPDLGPSRGRPAPDSSSAVLRR